MMDIIVGDLTQWMLATYFQVAGELYGDLIQRHVISSSYSVYPYTAGWYNRAGTPEDPTVMLHGTFDFVNRVIYSLKISQSTGYSFVHDHVLGASVTDSTALIKGRGGANVYIQSNTLCRLYR
jgi:hypothetical protein